MSPTSPAGPDETTRPVRVAIAGIGNCASSLVQGVEYYRNASADEVVPGLMHVVLGGYHVTLTSCGFLSRMIRSGATRSGARIMTNSRS